MRARLQFLWCLPHSKASQAVQSAEQSSGTLHAPDQLVPVTCFLRSRSSLDVLEELLDTARERPAADDVEQTLSTLLDGLSIAPLQFSLFAGLFFYLPLSAPQLRLALRLVGLDPIS
jgi:hypothetical protein